MYMKRAIIPNPEENIVSTTVNKEIGRHDPGCLRPGYATVHTRTHPHPTARRTLEGLNHGGVGDTRCGEAGGGSAAGRGGRWRGGGLAGEAGGGSGEGRRGRRRGRRRPVDGITLDLFVLRAFGLVVRSDNR